MPRRALLLALGALAVRLAASLNVAVMDGDSIVIPKGNTFFVFGEVKKPGAYPLDKETNILEGITIAGAQCHSHKYDPISQEEYFKVFAIFNQSEDSDKPDNSPNHPYLSAESAKKKAGR